jgi:hypothetical protein
MAKTIKIFTIDIKKDKDPIFKMPGVGRFLSLHGRFDSDYTTIMVIDTFWLVDDELPETEVQIFCTGTNGPVPDNAEYLGTAVVEKESQWEAHVFREDHRFEDVTIVDGRFVPKSQLSQGI